MRILRESATTILDPLRDHLETRRDRLAYTYLQDNDQRRTLSYADLDRRARSVAKILLKHVAPGERALMMYPAGLEFIEAFLGCLYAGVIAVPAYPPKRNRNAERILSIAEDCRPALLLGTSGTLGLIEGQTDALAAKPALLATDLILDDPALDLPEPKPSDTAFLQYTSGATGSPKGVIVSHANLVENERCIQQAFQQTADSVVCGWLPAFHDMGLIGTILQPLYLGCHSVLMSPSAFIAKPLRWLQAMSEFRATSSGAPNFAYEHCLKLIRPDDCRDLDLSRWEIAFNGAEPVRESTLRRFAERFAPCGFSPRAFFPCYGLAEATLFVSGGQVREWPRVERLSTRALEDGYAHTSESDEASKSVVSCGPVARGTKVRIVDPDTCLELPPDRIGEIWVRGASVSEGYWGNPAATRRAFHARLADGTRRTGGDPSSFLRTGDLGFLRDGELFVTGRLKDMVIIGGRNIYPQDVERLIENHLQRPQPNSVAAFGLELRGAEQLAVVIEADREQARLARRPGDDRDALPARLVEQRRTFCETIRTLHQAILRALDVSLGCVAFLAPGAFPRTSSGKIQRQRCKTGILSGDLPFLDLPMCPPPTIGR